MSARQEVKGLASDEPVLTLHVGPGSLVHLLLED